MKKEHEIKEEIKEQKKFLNRYFNNIESLLGIKGSREVKKSMLIYIANNL